MVDCETHVRRSSRTDVADMCQGLEAWDVARVVCPSFIGGPSTDLLAHYFRSADPQCLVHLLSDNPYVDGVAIQALSEGKLTRNEAGTVLMNSSAAELLGDAWEGRASRARITEREIFGKTGTFSEYRSIIRDGISRELVEERLKTALLKIPEVERTLLTVRMGHLVDAQDELVRISPERSEFAWYGVIRVNGVLRFGLPKRLGLDLSFADPDSGEPCFRIPSVSLLSALLRCISPNNAAELRPYTNEVSQDQLFELSRNGIWPITTRPRGVALPVEIDGSPASRLFESVHDFIHAVKLSLFSRTTRNSCLQLFQLVQKNRPFFEQELHKRFPKYEAGELCELLTWRSSQLIDFDTFLLDSKYSQNGLSMSAFIDGVKRMATLIPRRGDWLTISTLDVVFGSFESECKGIFGKEFSALKNQVSLAVQALTARPARVVARVKKFY